MNASQRENCLSFSILYSAGAEKRSVKYTFCILTGKKNIKKYVALGLDTALFHVQQFMSVIVSRRLIKQEDISVRDKATK